MHQSHLYTQLQNISLDTVRFHSSAKTLGDGVVPGSVKQDIFVKAIHCQLTLWMVLLKLPRKY